MAQVATDAQSETGRARMPGEGAPPDLARRRPRRVRPAAASLRAARVPRAALAPRTLLEAERFREVGRLDGAGVLLIGRRPFAIEVCDEPPASDALWAAAAEVFQAAAADAIARGEFLVVEPGGWTPQAERYALAGATRTPGEWLLRVEAAPARACRRGPNRRRAKPDGVSPHRPSRTRSLRSDRCSPTRYRCGRCRRSTSR